MELWNDGWGTGWVNWRNSSLRSRVTIALGVILTKDLLLAELYILSTFKGELECVVLVLY